MTRTPVIFSLFCILISAAFSAYAWINLPDLAEYPIHWNAQGQADGFGSRTMVGLNLLIFPLMTIFMAGLFYALPKIEPLRQNLEDSRRAYHTVWMLTVGFMVLVGALIAFAYTSPDGAMIGSSPRIVVASISLLFIGIGNVLSKVRQNFMLGIRTPWTLSSELSWEKTHRLGARAFVLAGLVSIISALLMPQIAFVVMTVSIIAVVLFSLIYSYVIWKSDPDKRR